jgi:hypothetical protein
MHDLDFQSKSAGPHLHVSYEGLGIGTPPIEEHSDQGRRGNQLMQQLEPFRPKLHTQCGYAREIAAWPIEAGNPTQLDRVSRDVENYRNCGSRRLCGQCRRRAARRGDDVHPTAHEISRKFRQPIVITARPPVFDNYVAILDVASFAQSLVEAGDRLASSSGEIEEMNPITGIRCCATPATGDAAAPPSSVMNSRRLMGAYSTLKDHKLNYSTVHRSKKWALMSELGQQLPLGADAECFRSAPISGPNLKLIDWPKGAKRRPEQVQQCARTKAPLFDHLVGAGEQRRRQINAQRIGGFEVDG